MQLNIQRLYVDAIVPVAMTKEAAGYDLHAYIEDGYVSIEPGGRALIKTGLRFKIEPGYEIQIRPRSGLALKYGVTVLNSPGTIDSDYRGEIGVILINHGNNYFEVRKGDRIAQMVISMLCRPTSITIGDILPDTERGESGFGSTGFGLSGLAGSIL